MGDGVGTGGLVGNNGGHITSSYSTSSVTGPDNPGGLVGTNSGSVTVSYSVGLVAGPYGGGLIGYNSDGSIVASYWNKETSGLSQSAGGTVKSTAEMIQQATFAAWDFAETWSITEGRTYPWLQGMDYSVEGYPAPDELAEGEGETAEGEGEPAEGEGEPAEGEGEPVEGEGEPVEGEGEPVEGEGEVPPVTKCSFSADQLEGYAPLTVTFNNQSENAESVRWYFGDDTESTEWSPIHVFETSGEYQVELHAYCMSPLECIITCNETIIVLDVPVEGEGEPVEGEGEPVEGEGEPVEGEGEPEGEDLPETQEEIAEMLLDNFDAIDTYMDGRLIFEEVQDILPELTREQFDALDLDGDGYLRRTELEASLADEGESTEGESLEGEDNDDETGCAGCAGCTNGKLNANNLQKRLGDWLLIGLMLLVMSGWSSMNHKK